MRFESEPLEIDASDGHGGEGETLGEGSGVVLKDGEMHESDE